MATESETSYCYNASEDPSYFLRSLAYLIKTKVRDARPLFLYYSYRITARQRVPHPPSCPAPCQTQCEDHV